MSRKAAPEDVGCYAEGHWGQYAGAHMIERATEFGYDDAEAVALAGRKLAEMYPHNGEPLSDDEHEALTDATDDAEAWLNANAAPDGFSFGWHDGEFYLWSNENWENMP